MASWHFWLQWVFNHHNSKGDYRLYKLWLRMTNEMPGYQVVGLSWELNEQFWQLEDTVNYWWNRGVLGTYIVFCLAFNLQHFLIR